MRAPLLLLFAGMIAGCASQLSGESVGVAEIAPGLLAGYLDKPSLPDSLGMLPPPPAPGSAAQVLDDEASQSAGRLRGTPRWSMASADAVLDFPRAADTFACALGAPISEEQTPRLYLLLRRILADAGLSTYAAKNHYRRTRPFLVNGQPTCTPHEEEQLAKDFSYPSGHSSLGWAWALVLAEIAPERADAIFARGIAFSESRVVCNVHWQSDVSAGRLVGSATVARLHADGGFQQDLSAAKAEYAAARAKGPRLDRDCQAEADALGSSSR